jgi:hypothetical protein
MGNAFENLENTMTRLRASESCALPHRLAASLSMGKRPPMSYVSSLLRISVLVTCVLLMIAEWLDGCDVGDSNSCAVFAK